MIRLNKKIAVLSIAAFIFAYISGGNLPYSIFYIFFVTIVLGIIYIIVAKKSVYARFKHEGECYNTFDSTNITIIVENLGIIPIPYIHVESKVLGELIEGYRGNLIFLGGYKNKWIENEIFFTKRGIYDLGSISLEVNDLFYILKSVRHIHNKVEIKVYPKVYNLSNSDLSGRGNYKSLIDSNRGTEDFSLIKDIRKYNTGDNLKKVHWKLSAKYGEMYVKNFDSISGVKCNLFINMHMDNLRNDISGIIEEDMVDFTVSLAKHMIINRIKTSLFINASQEKNIELESKEDFLELMEYFLKCKSDGTSEFTSFIKTSLSNIPKGNWIGIVSISVDDNLRNTIMNLKAMGYPVNIFYYSDILYGFKDTNLIKNMDFLKNLGIDCTNFKEILEKR